MSVIPHWLGSVTVILASLAADSMPVSEEARPSEQGFFDVSCD